MSLTLPSDDALKQALSDAPVVPLVQSDDPAEAIAISRALMDGGLTVLEVVLRTDRAVECLAAIAAEFPDVQVGAGTVLNAAQAERAADAGAKFIVSPGLTRDVVETSIARSLPVLPGIATASELQTAWGLGLRTVKFFPAKLAGGPDMIRALSSVFRGVSIMPTGGVNIGNLSDYLSIPAVMACGGSWLTPKAAVATGDFDAVTTLAREALDVARGT